MLTGYYSDGVIDGNLYTDKDLINNRIINGNVDAEGNIRNNGSGVINGSINVDGDLWNDGQINGTYVNAKLDSSQSNACGNRPLNVDETCNINAMKDRAQAETMLGINLLVTGTLMNRVGQASRAKFLTVLRVPCREPLSVSLRRVHFRRRLLGISERVVMGVSGAMTL